MLGLPFTGFLDEFFAFLFFFLMLCHYLSSHTIIPKPVRVFFVFIIIYFFYSIILHINTTGAILFDVIQHSKPYVAFWGAFYLFPCFKSRYQKGVIKSVFLFVLCTLLILLFYGPSAAIIRLTGHESGWGGAFIILACSYYYFSPRRKKDVIIMFVILSIGLFCGKAKFFGEYCIAIYLFFFCKKKIKISIKNVPGIIILLFFIVVVIWEKFNLYVVNAARGTGGDSIARVSLYLNSFNVLKDYFPLGSGFGTYASYASSKYYSSLYYDYGMNTVYGLEPDPQNGNFIADTYYPSIIGEFGIFGICLLIAFWSSILKVINNNLDLSSDMDDYRISILLMSSFLIEGIAGPLMLSNVGVPFMILFALVLNRSKKFKANE